METKKVSIEDLGAVAVLRLSNGVTNAIGPELVETLSQTLGYVKKSYGGTVLAGGSKFFSIGLDLPNLLPLNQAQMRDFWYAFDRVVLDLFTLPLPTACAICGHAVAGGTILALACDFRFACSGRVFVGLNEVRLGLPVPYLADLMLRQAAGNRAATKLLYFGELVESETAYSMGVIDGVFPKTDVEKIALEKISQLSHDPKEAFAAIKRNRVEAVCERFEKYSKDKIDQLLKLWFSPKVQTLLEEAAKKF
ncbi:MAG: hypothetical protein COS92_04980 [Desulfobacterales bacterium CG07_land_8_20_14_0_80_52_14]|nr:MAG: hypothetical protein COX20_07760 [Desulfobacterales bacterium CG23_combo_of_CG06-09_8_20_14_all_52_9]PIU49772.1 MAG: hypothetical protein COS92_04980 [Desulfobacterales bacterium CG07_land_8_20_14_0_80_52_14]